MNHKLYILLLLFLLSNVVYGQKTNTINNFVLKGTITDKKIHVIWLSYSLNKQRIKRKAYVKNGSFSFGGFIPSPVYTELCFNNNLYTKHDWGMNEVFLTPGNMTIALTGDSTKNALITGSAMDDDWRKLQKQKQPFERLKHNILIKSNEIAAGGNTPKNHAAIIKLGSENNKYEEQEKQIEYKFITSNPGSYLSPYLTNYHFDGMEELPLDSATSFYNSFTDSVKNSIAGKALHKVLLKHSVSAKGSIAPLFIRKDIGGKTINLKSFRGKNYVLLYFWASWSLYKSNEPAQLKSLYKKYHTKGLEIVGISQDFNSKDWKNAINENALGQWHNVLTKFNDGLRDKYNIEGMPPTTLILIDKQGKIVGRYLGEHPAWITRGDNDGNINLLFKKLIEVFGS